MHIRMVYSFFTRIVRRHTKTMSRLICAVRAFLKTHRSRKMGPFFSEFMMVRSFIDTTIEHTIDNWLKDSYIYWKPDNPKEVPKIRKFPLYIDQLMLPGPTGVILDIDEATINARRIFYAETRTENIEYMKKFLGDEYEEDRSDDDPLNSGTDSEDPTQRISEHISTLRRSNRRRTRTRKWRSSPY